MIHHLKLIKRTSSWWSGQSSATNVCPNNNNNNNNCSQHWHLDSLVSLAWLVLDVCALVSQVCVIYNRPYNVFSFWPLQPNFYCPKISLSNDGTPWYLCTPLTSFRSLTISAHLDAYSTRVVRRHSVLFLTCNLLHPRRFSYILFCVGHAILHVFADQTISSNNLWEMSLLSAIEAMSSAITYCVQTFIIFYVFIVLPVTVLDSTGLTEIPFVTSISLLYCFFPLLFPSSYGVNMVWPGNCFLLVLLVV